MALLGVLYLRPILLPLILLLLHSQRTSGQPYEIDWRTKLVQDLFNANYTADVIPTCGKENHLVTVKVDMSLRGILDVVEPRQVITVTAWQRWRWNDCRLKWNASDYGGLETLIVSSDRLWIPDVVIWDSAEDFDGAQRTVVILYASGHAYLVSPAIIKITCKIDITYFPFDRQACRVKYVSSSYGGNELDLVNKTDHGDVSLFVDNGEWELIGIPVYRSVLKYPCCPNPFPDVSYYIVMQRQPLYYIFNLVMPCLLITGISLLLFYLPPDSGEKISMGITVLLSLCVFLLMVSERMPATSETVPLIGQYFGATIIMVSLSCSMTVVVLRIHHSGANGREVPPWLKTLTLDYLARVFCMDTDLYDKATLESRATFRHSKKLTGSGRSDHTPEYLLEKDGRITVRAEGDRPVRSDPSYPGSSRLENLMEKQVTTLAKVDHILRQYRKDDVVKSEWRKVAMVVDRVLLVLMCLVGTTVCMVIFLYRPSYKDMSAADSVAATVDFGM